MVKIDFVNMQEPAINDTNLNQMQLNIENAINAQVAGDTLPIGSIMPYTSDTIPENWLLCDGTAISRTEYDLLFSIIGTTYGVGDGSTTFNLPNLKGRVAVGKDSTQTEFDTLGETGGEKKHTLTEAEMPSHYHRNPLGLTDNRDFTGAQNQMVVADSNDASGNTSYATDSRGGGQPHNILQPYQVTNYIIKARQSSGIVATVVDGLSSTSTTDALSANQGRVLNEKFDYSTTETRIGTWIDGKPLYRKVFAIGTLGNSAQNLTYTFSGNYAEAIKCYGFIKSLNSANRTMTQVADTTSAPYTLMFGAETENTDLKITVKRSSSQYWSDWSAYAIVEYTKTTD